MVAISASVKVNLEPLRRFRREVERDLRAGGNGHIRGAIRQWAVRYRTFLQRRYRAASRGDGTWPDLAASTRRRRRRGSDRRASDGSRVGRRAGASILIDTGLLFGALDPVFLRKPGQLQEDIPFGVRVGYGGPSRHGNGTVSIADIARIHQLGEGVVPVREVIVPPTEQVLNQMSRDMNRAIATVAGITGNTKR